MWGGPAMLPPDGDYPGGSSGVDMDGYLAFETGHGAPETRDLKPDTRNPKYETRNPEPEI